jgi:hypothetical protein
MCKKGCYKSSIAIDENKDYINTCILSENSQESIYNFCQEKFLIFDPKLINSCKLDMCNLCCVGMDSMKNKNYSIPNLKSCFLDCTKSYNSYKEERKIETSKDNKLKEKKECNSPEQIDIENINKEEHQVEASYLLENYMRNYNGNISENPVPIPVPEQQANSVINSLPNPELEKPANKNITPSPNPVPEQSDNTVINTEPIPEPQ